MSHTREAMWDEGKNQAMWDEPGKDLGHRAALLLMAHSAGGVSARPTRHHGAQAARVAAC